MAGRPLSARYAAYAGVPRGTAGVYVVERSDGFLKVGCTADFRERLKYLHRDAEAASASILRFDIVPGSWKEEAKFLGAMEVIAPPIQGKKEWFYGIGFEDAVAARAAAISAREPAGEGV